MAGSKEAELVTAALLYAVRCHAEGDQLALRAMNFGPREVQALQGLDLADLARARWEATASASRSTATSSGRRWRT